MAKKRRAFLTFRIPHYKCYTLPLKDRAYNSKGDKTVVVNSICFSSINST